MKKVIIFLIFLYLALPIKMLFAQESAMILNDVNEISKDSNKKTLPIYEFNAYPMDAQLENVSKEMAGEHPFGDLIAKKMYLLSKKYTSEEAITPGNPQTKTVIRKPVIYETVRQIERYLKKSVKKGEINFEAASNDFNRVLDVALNIATVDTRNFEAAIKSLKDNAERIDLFTKRVKLRY
jgi:hypothetical protein